MFYYLSCFTPCLHYFFLVLNTRKIVCNQLWFLTWNVFVLLSKFNFGFTLYCEVKPGNVQVRHGLGPVKTKQKRNYSPNKHPKNLKKNFDNYLKFIEGAVAPLALLIPATLEWWKLTVPYLTVNVS